MPRSSAARQHPVLQSRLTTYVIAAAALLVIALFAPTVATSWVMALLLIALIVGGIEVVRSIVRREVLLDSKDASRLP